MKASGAGATSTRSACTPPTLRIVLRQCGGAARKSAGQRGGQRLRSADAAIAAGAPRARHRRRGLDGARDQADDRLHQGAQGFRAADHRVPEHRFQARRAQDGSRDCARLRRLVRGTPRRGRTRHRDRVDGEVVVFAEASARPPTNACNCIGGYGYMQEYPISRMFVDSRIQKIYGGTNEIMKLLIARSL